MIEPTPRSLQLRVVRDDAEGSGVTVVTRSRTLVHRQTAATAANKI